MIKRIILVTAVAIILFCVGYFSNNYLLESNSITIRFSLLTAYLFNAIACLVIYCAVEIVLNYLPNETGYLYLGLTMVKMGVFILIFQDAIFSENELSKIEKTSIFAPVFMFLVLETIAVSKLLNNK